MEKTELSAWQKAAAAARASIVVLRWARHTGKDMLIEKLCDKETDFVIMPGLMAADNAALYEGRSVFRDTAINTNLLHFIKRKQKKHHRTKRIFLNECAFFDESLFDMIRLLQKEWPKAQIYLISTPRGGWKLGERGQAGLEFDMICARLEMSEVHDWYYSRQAAVAGDKEHYKHLNTPGLTQEGYAGWWDIVK